MPLSDEDLAYMRETQAEHRPTEASLIRTTRTSDGAGGWTDTPGDPQPIRVRIAGVDQVPPAVAEAVGPQVLACSMDLVPVTAGDRIVADGITYQVVSEGNPGAWATAQTVYVVPAG